MNPPHFQLPPPSLQPSLQPSQQQQQQQQQTLYQPSWGSGYSGGGPAPMSSHAAAASPLPPPLVSSQHHYQQHYQQQPHHQQQPHQQQQLYYPLTSPAGAPQHLPIASSPLPPPAAPPINLHELSALIETLWAQFNPETMSTTRSWICANVKSPRDAHATADFFIATVAQSPASFALKLTLLYVINDVIHHALRAQQFFLVQAFDVALPKFFATMASQAAVPPDLESLSNLINFWDQNKYFPPHRIAEFSGAVSGSTPAALRASMFAPPPPAAQPTPPQLPAPMPMDVQRSSQPAPAAAPAAAAAPPPSYDKLPAGLMVPLVQLEDHEYEPLDPRDILPLRPAPPSDELLQALQQFYAPDEDKLDDDGWEKGALRDFYHAKRHARQRPTSTASSSLHRSHRHRRASLER